LVYALAVNGNNVFAGTELHGVYVSSNNGLSWVQKNEGLGNLTIFSLRIVNNYIFAGASVNGVYRRQLGELVGLSSNTNQVPGDFSLLQNYPNPFNPSTKIGFSIPKSGFVKLNVFDAAGKQVSQLVNENLAAGNYSYDFKASGLASGAYFYMLVSGDNVEIRKMMLVK